MYQWLTHLLFHKHSSQISKHTGLSRKHSSQISKYAGLSFDLQQVSGLFQKQSWGKCSACSLKSTHLTDQTLRLPAVSFLSNDKDV